MSSNAKSSNADAATDDTGKSTGKEICPAEGREGEEGRLFGLTEKETDSYQEAQAKKGKVGEERKGQK